MSLLGVKMQLQQKMADYTAVSRRLSHYGYLDEFDGASDVPQEWRDANFCTIRETKFYDGVPAYDEVPHYQNILIGKWTWI